MTAQQLLKIRKHLPHGSMSKISIELHVSYNTVYKVLIGERKDLYGIIAMALTIAEEYKKKWESLNTGLEERIDFL